MLVGTFFAVEGSRSLGEVADAGGCTLTTDRPWSHTTTGGDEVLWVIRNHGHRDPTLDERTVAPSLSSSTSRKDGGKESGGHLGQASAGMQIAKHAESIYVVIDVKATRRRCPNSAASSASSSRCSHQYAANRNQISLCQALAVVWVRLRRLGEEHDQPTRTQAVAGEIVAGDTTITIVGNLTADPELRFTPSGAAVANFTVASTPRIYDLRPANGKTAKHCSSGAVSGRRAAEGILASPGGHESSLAGVSGGRLKPVRARSAPSSSRGR